MRAIRSLNSIEDRPREKGKLGTCEFEADHNFNAAAAHDAYLVTKDESIHAHHPKAFWEERRPEQR